MALHQSTLGQRVASHRGLLRALLMVVAVIAVMLVATASSASRAWARRSRSSRIRPGPCPSDASARPGAGRAPGRGHPRKQARCVPLCGFGWHFRPTVRLGDINLGSSFRWLIPTFALSVPGALIVGAVAIQLVTGLTFVELTRRWLGAVFRRRRVDGGGADAPLSGTFGAGPHRSHNAGARDECYHCVKWRRLSSDRSIAGACRWRSSAMGIIHLRHRALRLGSAALLVGALTHRHGLGRVGRQRQQRHRQDPGGRGQRRADHEERAARLHVPHALPVRRRRAGRATGRSTSRRRPGRAEAVLIGSY